MQIFYSKVSLFFLSHTMGKSPIPFQESMEIFADYTINNSLTLFELNGVSFGLFSP